jgi:hypothetical protein
MSDIFQEVDEEVRRERLMQLWKRYGNFVIAAAVILVLGVGAWRGYQWWEAKKAAEAGAAFDSAVELADTGKPAEAEAAFARLANQGPATYRVLARIREAAILAQRDPKAAVAAYDAIANDGSAGKSFQDLAAIRAASLLVDTAPLAEIAQRLEPLTKPDSPFRHSARELLALAAFKAGDKVAAKKWFDMIESDPETPQSLRGRIDILMTLSGDNTAKG